MVYIPPGLAHSYDATPIFIPPPPPPPAPTLTSITPNTGPVAGGTQSALVGTGLNTATQVWYGANAGTLGPPGNGLNRVVTSPAGAAIGNVQVGVVGPGGSSNPVQFDYQ